jgi:hypothetical protein
MERFKKMMENMSEEERGRMMERCFELMKEKEIVKDKDQDEKKKDESSCIPDMGKMAECCPGMMGTFFSKMKSCFEGKGNEEKKDIGEKTEK